MDPKKLKLKNLVYDTFDSKIVTEIELSDFQAIDNYQRSSNHPNTYHPIELTQSIVDKSKINEGIGIHNKVFSGLISVQFEANMWIFYIGTIQIRLLTFVHELQNLYSALTDEDLPLTIEDIRES